MYIKVESISKFTITVDDVQLEKFILNMLRLLQNNPGINFKKEWNDFIFTTLGSEDNFILAGKPMSWEELMREIADSEGQYKRGEHFSSDQIR